MKLFLVFFAVLGLSYAAPATRDLREDLLDLIYHIPIEQIVEIAQRFNAEDPEFQRVIAYLQGPEWAELVAIVAANPTWQAFKAYTYEKGVDIDSIIESLRELIQNLGVEYPGRGRSLQDFVQEVVAIIDTEALSAKFNDLLERPSFQEFWELVTSEESRAFVYEVRAEPEVQRVADELREMGIDVDLMIEVIAEFLGWN